MRNRKGFTLIEILIALAVFSVLAVIAYQGVARMAIAKQVMDADNRKWRELTVAMARFEDDFSQAANRSYINQFGSTVDPLQGAAGPLNSSGALLELVRYDGDRLIHLGYRLRQGHLELLLWNTLHQAPRTEPTALALLDHVKDFKLRFLDQSKQWQLSWPAGQATKITALPRGVEITLTLESGEVITRLFALP
ncbi:type II secretion system protein GspJ [Chitinimonas arctica]|uniref:Type II secretion system protein J n=1 Tax=Chitinimonas arctica TaxID=2594795 RepID=A0A516SIJ4_9NEIS|nr:type II secretion system minor pseudopilin GspJ [Chitinimonas arctica]QDQ27974.1 type II secretion system protein GspJ [Chitinimonas arctica]